VIVAPTITLRPVRSAALTAALRDLAAGEFAWLILTSPATVGMLDDRLGGPRDVRASVAAVGDGTAEAFRRWARRAPDLRPRAFTVAGPPHTFPRRKGHGPFPRGAGAASCARARTSPPKAWNAPSRRRDGRRSAWTPTARGSHVRFQPTPGVP
jgi:hypothetical protein